MEIAGRLTDDELIEYISFRLKLETLNNLINSKEYTDTEKVKFLRMYLKEGN